MLDEAGQRTKQEVENVKKMCNANLERLTEELYEMEMVNLFLKSQSTKRCDMNV